MLCIHVRGGHVTGWGACVHRIRILIHRLAALHWSRSTRATSNNNRISGRLRGACECSRGILRVLSVLRRVALSSVLTLWMDFILPIKRIL